MSRTGNKKIVIPAGVEFKQEGATITVKGSKGTLTRTFNNLENIEINVNEGEIKVDRKNDLKQTRMMHGTIRSHINNMINGVANGCQKELEVEGIGFRVAKEGKTLVMNLGFSHQVKYVEKDGIQIETPSNNSIIVKGIDKEVVGQVAAEIRAVKPPEPYKGKGIRYKDEIIIRKEGKKA